MKTICVYHKDCVDGTTSAAILSKKFQKAELIPLQHGYSEQELKGIIDRTDKNTTVYFTDFSLRQGHHEKLLETGCKTIIIDHHAGANELLKSVTHENFEYHFDNDESGATLTWITLFRTKPPEIVELVKDKDIWKWKHGDKTKYAGDYLFQYINQPERMLEIIETDIKLVLEKGKAISEYAEFLKKTLIDQTGEITLRVGKYAVEAWNVHLFHSEIGNIKAKELGRAVAMFYFVKKGVKVSFRSLDAHEPSAMELAQLLGGNGHRNAASAVVPVKEFFKLAQDKKL